MAINRDSLYLIHIRECLARVREYTFGGRDDFMKDTKTQDAVLRNLQIMGESTQRLSESLKAAHSQVKWRDLAAFRNILVHNYLGMDLAQIWQIITDDLPLFEQQIDAMIQSVNPT
jgi:uncharacterized protein with HEPN domain